MTDYALHCSQCHTMILNSVQDEIKLRSKILVLKGSNAYAVCKGCDSEIQVPLTLDLDMAKSLAACKKEPKLYLKC